MKELFVFVIVIDDDSVVLIVIFWVVFYIWGLNDSFMNRVDIIVFFGIFVVVLFWFYKLGRIVFE